MLFRQALGVAVSRGDTAVLAYAAMSNHLHLVVQAGTEPLGAFMKRLLGSLAWRANRSLDEGGALVGGRFKAILVEHETHLARLVAYVHANPVRVGAASDVWASAWTSARDYRNPAVAGPVAASRAAELAGTDLPNFVAGLDDLSAGALEPEPGLSAHAADRLARTLRSRRTVGERAAERTPAFLGGDALRRRLLRAYPTCTAVVEVGELKVCVPPEPELPPALAARLAAILRAHDLAGWTSSNPGRPPRALDEARRTAIRAATGLGVDQAAAAALIGVTPRTARRLGTSLGTLAPAAAEPAEPAEPAESDV